MRRSIPLLLLAVSIGALAQDPAQPAEPPPPPTLDEAGPVDAAAAEDGVVLAQEEVVDEPARLYLDGADPLQ